MSIIWPVPAGTPVTQPFGSSPNNGVNPAGGHTGTDFGTPMNTVIRAVANGTVQFASWATDLPAIYGTPGTGPNPWWINPNFAGIVVIIDHVSFWTVSAHLNGTALNRGDRVTQGQEIGKSGMTGMATGPHLHFETVPAGWNFSTPTFGRVNPANYCSTYWNGSSGSTPALKANERRVGPDGANIRSEAKTSAKVLRTAPGKTVEAFTGYVIGESFKGINIWFKDSQGFAWAGGFESQSVTGLPNLTPKPPAPALKANERKAGIANVNQRVEAKTTAKVVRVISGGTVEAFTGFVHGEKVKVGSIETDIWFKDATGYAWSGGFESQSTSGLPDQTPVTPPVKPPVTPPVTEPSPAYSFTPDFDFVEYSPAAGENVQIAKDNPGVTVFPAKPEKVVIHQFGTVGVDTLQSTVNTFKNKTSSVSAHFVVSGKRIIQMVSLNDRAYHAYIVGNNYVGIESDPAQDKETIASVNKLLKALKEKYGYVLTPVLHKDIPQCSTNCGASIDLKNYAIDAKPPVIIPPVEPVIDERAVLEKFADWQISQYLK